MSFGQPLPLGIDSDDDLVVVSVHKNIQLEAVSQQFDAVSPDGIALTGASLLVHEPQAPRIPAPMQAYGGARFSAVGPPDTVAALEELLRRTVSVSIESLIPAVGGGDDDASSSIVFSMNADAPGLGRILKEMGLRDRISITRTAMMSGQGPAGQTLFDFYCSLDACLASSHS
jgi:hypothetical protein